MKTWKQFLKESRDEEAYQLLIEATLMDLRNSMTPEEVKEYADLHDKWVSAKSDLTKQLKHEVAKEHSPRFRELWFSGKKDQIRLEIEQMIEQSRKNWKSSD
jgi:pantothenate kinase type III